MAVIDKAKVRYLPGTRATMRSSRAVNSPLPSATAMPGIPGVLAVSVGVMLAGPGRDLRTR
ncbi:hypothetical protein GCM10010244_77500 [Streptomyces coeruleorubidus]|nr:hypothetical protein GCM10010244_77500 [Streptomyces bellus]